MAAFVVAVTGGVAAGKSAVCRLFADRGVEVADADLAAREIVAAGQPALAEILARFGGDMLLADGQLDRAALRRRIFSDPPGKRDLEAITHPRIRERLRERCAGATGAYAIAAIPLLAESGGRSAYPWLRRILVVDATVELQRTRLQQRDDIDSDLAASMIGAQATRHGRLRLADDVIVNDGAHSDLADAVFRLDAIYRRLAGND
jgi:dephospho-CoA kinase